MTNPPDEAPTTRVSRLSPERQGLLRQWSRRNLVAARTADTIPRRGDIDRIPLSFAQRRLWFIHQLTSGSSAYNGTLSIRLRGPLNIDALRRSLNEVIRRHEAIRTIFPSVDGQPFQLILPHLALALPVVDLSGVPPDERDREAERRTLHQDALPFDLAVGPLVRALLMRLDDATHVLSISMHHMVCDGVSTTILVRELGILYDAYASDSLPSLPELPIQYADVAVWERGRAQAELEVHRTFWRRQLDGVPTVLNLPTDRPYPPMRSFEGASHRFLLPASVTAAIKRLSQQEGVTVFTTLLTAFQILLARYSGQHDMVIGTPIANRPRLETESLIGFFAGTLIFRLNVPQDRSFRAALHTVRSAILDATAHQDTPFEQIVDDLRLERTTSHNPLFQVMFNFGTPPRIEQTHAGLTFIPKFARGDASMFDLWLSMAEHDQDLVGILEYNTDIYDGATAGRIVEHFTVLLRTLVDQPDEPIARAEYLTERERRQLLVEWVGPTRVYSRSGTLPDLFEQQVRATPTSPALRVEGETLSYAALNERANRLAHLLRARHVGPDVIIGVCLERSVDMLVALLGILKAGAAYLPLDPTLPDERLAFMLHDSRVEIVVSRECYRDVLPGRSVSVIPLDGEAAQLSAYPIENPPRPHLDMAAAYVIYTSGSTGKPKGVLVPHRGIVNRLLWMQETYQLHPTDRILQKTPFSFDVSVWEFFWPLIQGACLVMARPEGHRDNSYLVRIIQAENITTLHFVPSMLRLFLQEPGVESCTSLRRVICSGEALPYSLAQQFCHTLPVELHNLYGPTEASVDVTSWQCAADHPRNCVPIGRPIANTQIYLLDEQLRLVPVGVPGELYIAGTGLARGYLNRPALTAERFIPNPFVTGSSAAVTTPSTSDRMYRTGDLARWLPDGSIEYLDRLDNQLKLRGFRIEPGEIEAVLEEHPAVQEAIVVLHGDIPGEKRLVAYVVPASGALTSHETGAVAHDQVHEWRQVFDQAYEEPAASDPTFNIAGWNSSFTGEPLPVEDMREWVESTVERVLALEPVDILEIGCGTGLLLFRVAPYCRSYTGTDVSPTALHFVRRHLPTAALDPSTITLREQPAHDLSGLPPGHFDTVILNSVMQYFPSADYALNVIRQAIELLKPGGRLFIGDLRSLPLLPVFHTAVAWHRADNEMTVEQLRWRIADSIARESELAFDPRWFLSLPVHCGRIGPVQVLLKCGSRLNELTQFRYDVALELDTSPQIPPVESIAWQPAEWNLDRVRRHLEDQRPDAMQFVGISDSRLAEATAIYHLVRAAPREDTPVSALRAALAATPAQSTVSPAAFAALEESLPYRADIAYSGGEDPLGRYDVTLIRSDLPAARRRVRSSAGYLDRDRSPAAGQSYTNAPLRNRVTQSYVATLRGYLKERVPDYMIPAHIVPLDALPLNANGKIDRHALPAPDIARISPGRGFDAPLTAPEIALARVWSRILGVENIGRHDNFFELGGDSISSVQIVARALQEGIRLTPRALFQHQTIAELAAVAQLDVEQARLAAEAQRMPLTPEQRRLVELGHGGFDQLDFVVLPVRGHLDPDQLGRALDRLAREHAVLAMRLEGHGTDIWLAPLPDGRPVLCSTVLPIDIPSPEDASRSAREATTDQDQGALFRAHLVSGRAGSSLVLVGHRLALDTTSWAIVLEDLAAFYQEPAEDAHTHRAPPAPFGEWALHRSAIAPAAPARRALASSPQDTPRTSAARPPGDSAQILVDRLPPDDAHQLLDACAAYRTTVEDLLVAALARTLASGDSTGATIDLYRDGRGAGPARSDFPRTVGRFSPPAVVALPAHIARDSRSGIQHTKEQLRGRPPDGSPAATWPRAAFCYQPLDPRPVSSAPWDFDPLDLPYDLWPDLPPCSLIVRSCGDELRLVWQVRGEPRALPSIHDLAHRYRQVLTSLIAHCVSPDAGGYTPSDFPLANLDQEQLDHLYRLDPAIDDVYPLAPMQRSILRQRAHTGNPELYWLCACVLLRGAHFDLDAYRKAWQQTIDRHPTIRTSVLRNGLADPRLIVHRHAPITIETFDWRDLTPAEQQASAAAYLRAMREHGPALDHAPHMRVTLCRLNDRDYFLFRAFNYMLQDGWSSTLIGRDFDAFYEACCRGETRTIPQTRRYRDFIAWLQQQPLASIEQYFHRVFDGFTGPTPLLAHLPPAGNPHDDDPLAFLKASLTLSLPATTALQSLGRRHHLTLSALLYSTWALILSAYCEQSDIVFGSVCSGRPAALPGVEYIVGMFNNILPLRVSVVRSHSLMTLMRHVQAQLLELREYEYSSIIDIKRWLGMAETDLLFESYAVFEDFPMYSYQHVGSRKEKDFGVAIADNQQIFVPTEYPIRVEFWPLQTLIIRLSCYQRYTGIEALQRILGHFQTILDAMIADSDRGVGDVLDLLETERTREVNRA